MIKSIVLSLIVVATSLLFGFLVIDAILGWHLNTIAQSSKLAPGLMRYHYKLGWELSPNWTGKHEHYDFDVSYSINDEGFRQQTSVASSQSNQIAILGDSFTFGFGVNDNETFSQLLNNQVANQYFINYGVPGYSTDQEYLLLKDKLSNNKISQVLLVFYLGNDILDNALSHPLQAEPAKPYFKVVETELQLENVPVPKVRKSAELKNHSLISVVYGDEISRVNKPNFFTKFLPNSNILKLIDTGEEMDSSLDYKLILDKNLQSQKILLRYLLQAIKQELSIKGIDFTVVILPGQSYLKEKNTYSYSFQEYVRKFLINTATIDDINLLDLAAQIAALPDGEKTDLYFKNEGHLSVKGHRLVSDLIHKSLFLKDKY